MVNIPVAGKIIKVNDDDCKTILRENKISNARGFRKWALKNHPDKGGDTVKFQFVSGCFDEIKGGKNKISGGKVLRPKKSSKPASSAKPASVKLSSSAKPASVKLSSSAKPASVKLSSKKSSSVKTSLPKKSSSVKSSSTRPISKKSSRTGSKPASSSGNSIFGSSGESIGQSVKEAMKDPGFRERVEKIREDQGRSNKLFEERIKKRGGAPKKTPKQLPKTRKQENLDKKSFLEKTIKPGSSESSLDKEKDAVINFKLPFNDFQKNIGKELGEFKDVKKSLRNECANPPKKFELRPHQKLISAYFKPSLPIKGTLMYYSIGSGKTAAAVNLASHFEKKGYSVLWVTRRTLVKDIEKNLFDKTAHSIIQEAVDKKIIPDTFEAKKNFFRRLRWLGIVSYKTFSNLCAGKKTELHHKLVKRNGSRDIFRKTIIIIDEIHKLYDLDSLSKLEAPDTPAIEKAIQNSYSSSGDKSARLLVMSGTPVTPKPEDTYKILNLLKKDNFVSPGNSDSDLINKIKGLVFYFDMAKNPNFFAQPEFKDINIQISSKKSTLEQVDTKSDIEYQKDVLEKKCTIKL